MKISLSRRVTAVVAALGLALVAVPASAANADDHACGLGETCDGVLSGPLGDSTFKIKVPENFNGTVLLYSKGYSSSVPIPAGIAVPLGYADSPYYSPMTIPGLGAGYAANGSATVVPPGAAEAESVLLNQGYALAGTGMARQGWAVAQGVESGENLIKRTQPTMRSADSSQSGWTTTSTTVARFAADRSRNVLVPTCTSTPPGLTPTTQ